MALRSFNFSYQGGGNRPYFSASCKHGFGIGFSLIFGGFWGSKILQNGGRIGSSHGMAEKNGFRAIKNSPGRC